MGATVAMKPESTLEYAGEEEDASAPFPLTVAHCSRPNQSYGGGTCLNQCINGFGVGAMLGSVVGVLFGGIQTVLGGPETKGIRLRLFLKTVGGSTLSFGVFLMAGSAIRCEEQQPQRFAMQRWAPPATVSPAGVGLGVIFMNRQRLA